MKDNKIKFIHSMGFVGSSYSMKIDDTKYSFGFVSEDEARELVKEKLTELNIEYNQDIEFKWDGTI